MSLIIAALALIGILSLKYRLAFLGFVIALMYATYHTIKERKRASRVFSSGPYMYGFSQTVGKVDTKTLVVGQDVYMFSGCYVNKGKVVKVTTSGADVQTGEMQNDGTWDAHELLHFDNNGRSYVTELPSSYDSTAHPMSPWGWNGNGTYECGPWELDGIPFAERDGFA